MELKFSIAALLLLSVVCVGQIESREITHEDIKDAMLSLVHMMRDNTEKLERHEARDRQTAEYLKKAVSLLTKRMSTIDGLKAYLVKLDERVGGIEQLITQKDERERIQLQKTADTLEDLESRLEGWATEIETKVVEGASRAISAPSGLDKSTEILSMIDKTETKLTEKIGNLEAELGTRLDKVADVVDVLDNNDILTEVRQRVKDMSQVLNKLETNANTSTETPSERGNQALAEDQIHALNDVQQSVLATLEEIRKLPRVSELQTMHNESQMSLQETRHALKDAIAQGNELIESRMAENKEEVQDSMTSLRSNMANYQERIHQELNDLSKGQSVMVEMADHVLDTKKRLEHAYKILREVGELVMTQGLNINNTLNTRFDGISNDIMDNQNGALANLTVKMEQEMDQVWRQINVMYQKMTESATALDKLHKQNEAYVNGTTSTMDGMENKVGEITARMNEVDTNLNYLLGRLSLVTHEFNQIKQGLGAALDNIKASFKAVQEKANDLSGNPGPHPVPQDYRELDETSQPTDPAVNASP